MRVAIVGAGVAGLATAGSLQRSGHQVTVLEEAPQLRTGGAAISVWNNGAMALKHLGITLDSHGRVIERLELRSEKGHIAGVIDARRLSESIGIEAVTVGRGELLEHLQTQLQPGTIFFNAPCTAVTESERTATLHLGDGNSIAADLVVGADGQRSVVRSLFAPAGPPAPTGWASLQGLTPVPLAITDGTTSIYAAGKVGAVGLMPAGRGLLQWWFDVPWPPPVQPASVLDWLRNRFSHWGSPVARRGVRRGDRALPPRLAQSSPPTHLAARRPGRRCRPCRITRARPRCQPVPRGCLDPGQGVGIAKAARRGVGPLRTGTPGQGGTRIARGATAHAHRLRQGVHRATKGPAPPTMGLYGCVAGGDVFVQQHGLAYRGLIHAGSGCPNPPELRYPLGRVSSLFVADSVWSVQENVDSVVAFIEDFG